MKIDDTELNLREKGLLKLMCGLGKAVMEESRKTSITQNACHLIVISPEIGYVKAEMYCDGKVYKAIRFDQFPEIDVKVTEDKNKHFMGKD